jgi:glutamine---fructose-6-phosphate transaminase (isomerizing)
MCGLFGLIRNQHDRDPAWASRMFVALGQLAQERGRDAAGFVLVGDHPAPNAYPGTSRAPIRRRDVQLGRCRVVKDTCRWAQLWRQSYWQALDSAVIAFGHTRHASQGAPGALANTAPLVVGDGLIGTHNGDVDAEALRRALLQPLPTCQGETDSEVLLLALDRVRTDLPAVCDLLSTVEGLAALAWLDRQLPDLVFLARAALCPLAIAWDGRGNLYWASSPAWFRHLDDQAGGRLGLEVDRVTEGTLLAITAGTTPTIVARQSFEPVARPGDDRRFPTVWNGLDPSDIEAFQAEIRHRIVDRAL